MQVCKIGGPCYRIGMGGGAASSRASGEADSELDFNAVQRGDAEMENKLKYVTPFLWRKGRGRPRGVEGQVPFHPQSIH